jgi:hypothetical protein
VADDRCPTCNHPRDLVPISQWGEAEPVREVPHRCCGPAWSPPTDQDEHDHWRGPRPTRRATGWTAHRKRTVIAVAICTALTAAAIAWFAIGAWGAGVAFTSLALMWATYIASN